MKPPPRLPFGIIWRYSWIFPTNDVRPLDAMPGCLFLGHLTTFQLLGHEGLQCLEVKVRTKNRSYSNLIDIWHIYHDLPKVLGHFNGIIWYMHLYTRHGFYGGYGNIPTKNGIQLLEGSRIHKKKSWLVFPIRLPWRGDQICISKDDKQKHGSSHIFPLPFWGCAQHSSSWISVSIWKKSNFCRISRVSLSIRSHGISFTSRALWNANRQDF